MGAVGRKSEGPVGDELEPQNLRLLLLRNQPVVLVRRSAVGRKSEGLVGAVLKLQKLRFLPASAGPVRCPAPKRGGDKGAGRRQRSAAPGNGELLLEEFLFGLCGWHFFVRIFLLGWEGLVPWK